MLGLSKQEAAVGVLMILVVVLSVYAFEARLAQIPAQIANELNQKEGQ